MRGSGGTRLPSGVQHGLLRRGHDVAVLPPRLFGGAQFVRVRDIGAGDAVLEGATEPRTDGVMIGF